MNQRMPKRLKGSRRKIIKQNTMIFDILKKLIGGIKSLDDVVNTNSPETKEKTNKEVFSDVKGSLNKVFSPIDVVSSVRWNGKIYGVGGCKVAVSDDGNKWEEYTVVPLDCKEIKLSVDNQLMVYGCPLDNGNLVEAVKSLVKINSWYKLKVDGIIEAAVDPSLPTTFGALDYNECEMIIEGKKNYVRVYEITPFSAFCSSDKIHWKILDFFPKKFQEFKSVNGISYAIDVEGEKYVYFEMWSKVAFETDMEIWEQESRYYDDLKEPYYKYEEPDDEDDYVETKKMHLLIVLAGSKKYFANVIFVNKEGGLSLFYPNLPGLLEKVPKKVENCCGVVMITMPNDKTYTYYNNKWQEMSLDDDEKKVGPSCFETVIYNRDIYWDPDEDQFESAGGFFKNFWGGSKSNNEPKERSVYYKILKYYESVVFYSNDGEKWFFHSILPSEFKSVTFEFVPQEGAVVFLKNKKYYQWNGEKWEIIKLNEFDKSKIAKKIRLYNAEKTEKIEKDLLRSLKSGK